MLCKKCGIQNTAGERFCKNCGVLLENSQSSQQNQIPQYSNMNGGLDPNYINQAVNPNMKKWAILCKLSWIIPVSGTTSFSLCLLSYLPTSIQLLLSIQKQWQNL